MFSKKKHGRGNRSEDSDYDDDDNGWMKYSDGPESLSSFVRRKLKMEQDNNFREQWERVICPTIQMKYVTIRCNLNNEVRKAYKGKSFLKMFVLIKRT